MEKTSTYTFMAEPFHCDFSCRLAWSHLGNHLLNAADFHANERQFGMTQLNPQHQTWVLSRLAIEMDEMPQQYTRFGVTTWIESVVRLFTHRNFRIADAADPQRVYGHGRSVWALIDTRTRQPLHLATLSDGALTRYACPEEECTMAPLSRVKMAAELPLVRTLDTVYSDVDVNGHINSVKYIEHVLNLLPLDWYREHRIKRLDIAYVAESYYGDRLRFYRDDSQEGLIDVRVKRQPADGGEEQEVVRCRLSVE